MKVRTLLVAVVSVAMLVTACGDDDGGDAGFSTEVRNQYLQGCMTGQNQAFCECTLDELEKRFTQDEFVRFAIEASETPPDPQIFTEVALACIAEANPGG